MYSIAHRATEIINFKLLKRMPLRAASYGQSHQFFQPFWHFRYPFNFAPFTRFHRGSIAAGTFSFIKLNFTTLPRQHQNNRHSRVSRSAASEKIGFSLIHILLTPVAGTAHVNPLQMFSCIADRLKAKVYRRGSTCCNGETPNARLAVCHSQVRFCS